MINRTLAAGCMAGLAAVALLWPLEASARGGGFGAGRAMAFHGGFHQFPGRRFVPLRPGFRQAVRPRIPVRGRFVRDARFRHHGRDSGNGNGNGVGWGDGGGYYGPSYDPSYGQPVDPGTESGPVMVGAGAMPYGRSCRSVVQTVPRERGGTAEVTITRCYPVNE